VSKPSSAAQKRRPLREVTRNARDLYCNSSGLDSMPHYISTWRELDWNQQTCSRTNKHKPEHRTETRGRAERLRVRSLRRSIFFTFQRNHAYIRPGTPRWRIRHRSSDSCTRWSILAIRVTRTLEIGVPLAGNPTELQDATILGPRKKIPLSPLGDSNDQNHMRGCFSPMFSSLSERISAAVEI